MARSWVSRLWPAATFQFCFIAAVAMLKPGANALVLSRFQADALPWLYVAAAVITGALAVLVRSGGRTTPTILAAFGGVTSILFAAGVRADLPFIALAAYLFAESFATQISLSFWASMSDAFDAREARRAFTWINGVGMSGAIAGGFGAQLLARSAGAIALLVAGGALLVVAAAVFRFHQSALEQSRERQPVKGDWRGVLELPYARLLAAVVIGFSMIQQLTDFVFRHRASDVLAESAMADLFAAQQLWTGVFCVLFQLLAAELLLRKLGILKYIAMIPLVMAALSAATFAVPGVWSAWALKLFESAASWSMLPVAFQLLYAPLPDESRDGLRRTIDGFLRKGGMGVAGVLLVGLAAVHVNVVVAMVFGLCLALATLLWLMRPRYIEAVHQRVAGVEPHRIDDADERLLVEALKAESVDRALRAADLLEHAGLVQETHVRSLLAHPHERAQERGVRLAESLKLGSVAKLLEAMVVTGARRPRDAAIWALSRLNPERARVVLPALVSSNDIGVQTAAVGGLLTLAGPKEPKAVDALGGLLKRGARAPAAERREVARLLGRLADTEQGAALQRYLEDTDTTVRRLAIHAVGEGKYVELAPRLLRFLSWRDDRRAARVSLANLGDPVVPLVASTLDDRSRSLSLRMQLPRVLRSIGTQAAFDALLYSNAHDEASLHYRVGVALARLREDQPGVRVDRERVHEAIERRRETWRGLVEPWRDVRAALGDSSLLTRVVGDRLDQAVELCFWLLGLTHDGRALRRAHTHLLGGDARKRAWALELLDNELTPEERATIADPIERHHRSQPPGDPDRLSRHLERLCMSEDSAMRACARQIGRWVGAWREPLREDDMSDVTLKRLFALEGVEVFAQCDVDDLAAVAAVAREQSFRKGERIYAEGDPGDALYVIIQGGVEARRDDEVVLTQHEKESFGETSLFDGAPRINEVIATADSKMLVIDRRDFLDLLADRPDLLTGMFRMLSQQLKNVVVEMATRRATTGEMPAIAASKEG